MGRYKYDQFKGSFSKGTIDAIIKDLKESNNICEDDYDWNVLDIRVKKANYVQRHRFKDTVEKLKNHINETPFNYVVFSNDNDDELYPFTGLMRSLKSWSDWPYHDEKDVREFIQNGDVERFSRLSWLGYGLNYKRYKTVKGIHLLKVSQFSRITGRNRKTVEDWARKGLISSTNICRVRHIEIEKTIENLEKM